MEESRASSVTRRLRWSRSLYIGEDVDEGFFASEGDGLYEAEGSVVLQAVTMHSGFLDGREDVGGDITAT